MDIIVMHKTTDKMPLVIKQEHIDMMKKHADNVYWFETEEEVLKSGVDAEIIFCWGGTGTPPEAFCAGSKKLKWLNTFSAGVDPLIKSTIADMPITVTNARGVHGKSMALTTLGYLISDMRRLGEFHDNQRNHIWRKPSVIGTEPDGLVLGIVGAGAIGSWIAKYSKMIGFKVIGVKRTVVPLENYDEMYSDKELDKALSVMDYVIVLTPLSAETRHLFNADRFKAMKDSAYFINIARGGVVDEAALTEALRTGQIRGAALDAADPEPMAPDNPLWDMPNVFVTPHSSAASPYIVDRAVEQFCENVENFKAGRPLFNIVDLKNS